MPHYHYLCKPCEKRLIEAKGGPLNQEEELEGAIFETSHSMNPTKQELRAAKKCPRCGSRRTHLTVNGITVGGYVLGDGYLDREGVRRDINLFHLTGKDAETGQPLDPYGHMRQAGEADDLAVRIKRAGKRGNQKHFVGAKTTAKDMAKAVTDAVLSKPTTPPPSSS